MRIQEHIDKISWSAADKVILIIYGLVTLFQINHLPKVDWGLFYLLLSMNNYIFIICDSMALQGLIQFGMKEESRKKANAIALSVHVAIALGISLFIFLFNESFAEIFNEEKLILVANYLPIFAIITIPRMFAIKIFYRNRDLKKVFITDFIHFGSMTALTFIIIFSADNFLFDDIVNIFLAGSVLSSLFSILLSRKDLQFSLTGTIRLKQMLKFGLPVMLNSGLYSLPKTLDVLVVQRFFGTETTAVYGSAKSLFRVFDEATNASYGLIYPVAVKLINENKKKELIDLFTKASSFMFAAFFIGAIILWLGFTDFITANFLPASYSMAAGQFNILLIAALAFPFVILPVIIQAQGHPEKVLQITVLSLIFGFIGFAVAGYINKPVLSPLGLVSFYYAFGIIGLFMLRKRFEFPLSLFFRAFGDSINFIRKKFGK